MVSFVKIYLLYAIFCWNFHLFSDFLTNIMLCSFHNPLLKFSFILWFFFMNIEFFMRFIKIFRLFSDSLKSIAFLMWFFPKTHVFTAVENIWKSWPIFLFDFISIGKNCLQEITCVHNYVAVLRCFCYWKHNMSSKKQCFNAYFMNIRKC